MHRLNEKDVYAFVQLFSNNFMKIVKNMTITAWKSSDFQSQSIKCTKLIDND